MQSPSHESPPPDAPHDRRRFPRVRDGLTIAFVLPVLIVGLVAVAAVGVASEADPTEVSVVKVATLVLAAAAIGIVGPRVHRWWRSLDD